MSTIVLSGQVADVVETEAKAQGYSSNEEFIYEAVKLLVRQNIEASIDRGIADVEAGRYEAMDREGAKNLVNSLFDKHTRVQ